MGVLNFVSAIHIFVVRFLSTKRMMEKSLMKFLVSMLFLVSSLLSQILLASEYQYDNDYLSQDIIRKSISDTLEVLNKVYVYPDKAKEIQREITKRMHKGSYDNIETKEEFRSRITADLRAVSKDGHLSIMLVKEDKDKPTHIRKETVDERKYNFAFQKVEVLGGNVGYMKFNKFYQDDEAKLTVDHAFGFLGNTDAMIFDLRDCIGGSPELAKYILSYFFKEKTILSSIHDRGDKSTYDHVSIEGVGDKRFKSNYPLFILIGPDTASAAEFFSYTLKHFGKATIVGKNSQGIAHLVTAENINQYFYGRFSIARPVNPITKDSWEGAGVIPDIATNIEKSLEVAHSEALKSLEVSMSKTNQTKSSKATPKSGAL